LHHLEQVVGEVRLARPDGIDAERLDRLGKTFVEPRVDQIVAQGPIGIERRLRRLGGPAQTAFRLVELQIAPGRPARRRPNIRISLSSGIYRSGPVGFATSIVPRSDSMAFTRSRNA
jgi:hypothetical protein